jgi:dihydroorotate dehydrogenase electron transfer subunit
MACGVGVCLVCVCKTKGSDGEIENSRCCADGPVFDAEAVVW